MRSKNSISWKNTQCSLCWYIFFVSLWTLQKKNWHFRPNYDLFHIKSFVPNAPRTVFWYFQGVEKGCIANKWIKKSNWVGTWLNIRQLLLSYTILEKLVCLKWQKSFLVWIQRKQELSVTSQLKYLRYPLIFVNKILQKIWNSEMLGKQYFPQNLKLTVITIFKKEDPTLAENYRLKFLRTLILKNIWERLYLRIDNFSLIHRFASFKVQPLLNQMNLAVNKRAVHNKWKNTLLTKDLTKLLLASR